MLKPICFSFLLCLTTTLALGQELPEYLTPVIYGRTGVTSFNMPNGSSIASPTISVDDDRNVALDINFVGNTGNAGLFFATNNSGTVDGDVVFNASDIIAGDPSQNGNRQAIFSVGIDDDLFVYDDQLSMTFPLNLPLGATGTSSLTLDDSQRIGGRIRFGFDGDAYGTFPATDSGFPSLVVYAVDSGLDASSPFLFLFSPDMSRENDQNTPKIAAKVSTVAGVDFEEIRIFEASGNSTLVAVETELDPQSPFSEFVTNSISISDNGNKVAFQANDTAEVSGIYVFDTITQTTILIADTNHPLVNSIDFFPPDVNDDGVVVFRGDDQASLSSVFVGNGMELIRLAGEGDTIQTDIGKRQLGRRDGSFSQSGAPRINNRNDVGMIFQYFDVVNKNSVADGSLIMVVPAQACLIGDVNLDGFVDLLDVAPFVLAIGGSVFSCEADANKDGVVDLLDVATFVAVLSGE